MAFVPNREQAEVPYEKVVDYLLSPTHPVGRSKAAFLTRHGFDLSSPDVLIDAMLDHVRDNEIAHVQTSRYGSKFRVDGPLLTPDGRSPLVSTVWIIDADGTLPRFVTAFPC